MSDAAPPAAWDEAFIVEIRGDMLRFAGIQLRDDQLAEDVVQEALVAALDGRQRFAGRSSLKTWVFSILRNKIVDVIRQRSRTCNLSAFSAEEETLDQTFDTLFKANEHWAPHARPADWGNPEDALHQEQFWAVFEACLKHLPESTARVFMMREFLGFDTDEVCRELGISMGNCHVILHRARNSLRLCLGKSWFAQGAPAC